MDEQKVPAAEAAVRVGVNRERLVRKIQAQEVRGECIDGKWYIPESEISRLRQPAELVKTIKEEAAEKKAAEKAADDARLARIQKRADVDLRGEPLPESIRRMTIPGSDK